MLKAILASRLKPRPTNRSAFLIVVRFFPGRIALTDRIKKAGRHVNQNEGLIFEQSAPGKRGAEFPPLDVPAVDARTALGEAYAREGVAGFPEVSEIEVIRHFTPLSPCNYPIDLR